MEEAIRDHFWLSNEAWAALEPHLPKNQPGARGVDDRRVISGILHILETGGRWQDVPPDCGPAKTIYDRYARWARRGVWQRILAVALTLGNIADSSMAQPMLEVMAPTRRLIADKAYDADRLRGWHGGRGIETVIPGAQSATSHIRSTGPPTGVETLSSACSANSKTGNASPRNTTALPSTT